MSRVSTNKHIHVQMSINAANMYTGYKSVWKALSIEIAFDPKHLLFLKLWESGLTWKIKKTVFISHFNLTSESMFDNTCVYKLPLFWNGVQWMAKWESDFRSYDIWQLPDNCWWLPERAYISGVFFLFSKKTLFIS